MKQLLGLARKGDRAALDTLLTELQGKFRVSASRRLTKALRTRMRTSDVLQTTYLHVVKAIESFEGEDEDAFVVWVTRILENSIRDRARFFGRKKRKVGDSNEEDIVSDPADRGGTPSKKAMELEDLRIVGEALAKLPEEQRVVIRLRLIEGREYSEIARMLSRNEGAVRMMVTRARAALALEVDRLADEH